MLGLGQNLFILEYDHVAYQIKGYDPFSNMVAKMLPVDPLPQPWGSKDKKKQNMAMLHIK